MSWEPFVRHKLKCSYLYALSLVNQNGNLLFCEFFFHSHNPILICQHLLGESLQQLTVVDAFVLSERLEIVIIGHV